MSGLDILSDGLDEDVTWDVDIRLACRLHAGTSILDRADHLRGRVDAVDLVILADIQGRRGL